MRPAGTANGLKRRWPAADSRASSLRENGRRRRPDDRSGRAMNPPQRARERMTSPTVDRKHQAFVEGECREDDERLLEERLGADLLVLAGGDVAHHREGHGMLSEHRPLKYIQ